MQVGFLLCNLGLRGVLVVFAHPCFVRFWMLMDDLILFFDLLTQQLATLVNCFLLISQQKE